MSIRRPFASLTLFAVAIASLGQESAEAGPLCDWLFGGSSARPAYAVGQPVPVGNVVNRPITNLPPTGYPASGYAANYGNYYGSLMPVIGPSGYGYPAAQPTGVAAATAPTIMSYVPDYRTTQYRAPVTYYRPLMTTDPSTGAQVVALAPCTSYEYQTQRVPAFGYNGLTGSFSTPPVQPPLPSMPTYTLPSGGVPLATGPSALPPNSSSYAMGYGGYTNSNTMSPRAPANVPANSNAYGNSYSSNYGSYSPQQPTLSAPPNSNYPTQPFSTTPGYYGSATGGSVGSYVAPTYIPGLVAPQGPATFPSPPSTQIPSTQYQSAPYSPNTFPMAPPPFVPSNGSNMPSRDPAADAPPSLPVLPSSGTSAMSDRPQLRAIVRQPLNTNSLNGSVKNSEYSENVQSKTESARQLQAPKMDPIPAPADLDKQPRWNPGLLNEQDRTALLPGSPNSSHYTGQSKAIQWASFQNDSETSSREIPPERGMQQSGLRAITPSPSPSAAKPFDTSASTPLQPTRQYGTGGWKATK